MRRLSLIACVCVLVTSCGYDDGTRLQKRERKVLQSLKFPSSVTKVGGVGSFPIRPGRSLPQRRFQFPKNTASREGLCLVFTKSPDLDERITISKKTSREICDFRPDPFANDEMETITIFADVQGCGGGAYITSVQKSNGVSQMSFALACSPVKK